MKHRSSKNIGLSDFIASLVIEKQDKTYDELTEKYSVNKYYLWHIINTPDYDPPDHIKEALGIQKFEAVPVCSCGEVHLSKTCPHQRKPRRRKDLFSYAVSALAWMIQNREEQPPP